MHKRVCVYVWNSVLKGQNILTIPFLFYSLLGVEGKIGVKCDIFIKIACVSFTYIILQLLQNNIISSSGLL